jgi:uncharacterized protein (TIGR02246 family)
MRRILIAVMLGWFAGALASCTTFPNAPYIERADVMESARRIAERYASTWNANDMTGFGALYTPDARHVTLNGEFLRGRAAIVAAHRASRARYAESVRMVTRLEGARAITRDAVVAVIRVEYVNDPSHPGAVQAAILTLTLVERSGQWFIAQAHASEA